MKLSTFITQHMEAILVEWEAFARTQQPEGAQMSTLALRDHAKEILRTIALDMDTHETAGQQYRKSQGRAPPTVGAETAASTHGSLRHLSGFSLAQLNAEFRALRATVLRLWLPTVTTVDEASTRDMIRFNETIDQALAESIVTYSEKSTRSRDTFLAILGHDLRGPLQTISMAGEMLARGSSSDAERQEVSQRVRRSAAAMSAMVSDLLEYARSQLGGGIPINPQPGDLGEVCRHAIADARLAHPACTFEIELHDDLRFSFDESRIKQLLWNLLNNAVQYRSAGEPVSLRAAVEENQVVLRVRNTGTIIPPASLSAIFDPMVQLAVEPDQQGRPFTSLGLGLFIAREITVGHGGSIDAASGDESGTVFTVTLPR